MVNERSLHIREMGDASTHLDLEGPEVATIGLEIECDKEIFYSYSYDGWKDVHHDLFIICAAVEYADRRWARGLHQWERNIYVTVPVLDLSTWLNCTVYQSLRDTLRHLTGDSWNFTFVKKEDSIVDGPRQGLLFLMEKEFVIAYSEGLDSLCVSGLHDEDDNAVRVRVSKYQQQQRTDERPFDRLPFNVSVKRSSEDSVRSRGFKFAVITAIAAHLSDVNRIIVPESGQGALGPVLLPLRGVYPDYRNHPTFFRRMEKFIQATLRINLSYEQPRLWYTKGQTIAAFLAKPGIDAEQVINTRSCWQQRSNVRFDGKLWQCGVCAACQLRRMSLHSAGVDDPPDTYSVSNLAAKSFSAAKRKSSNFHPTETLREYGILGSRHLQQLADLAGPSAQLESHALELAKSLGQPVDDVLERLREMLLRHALEWEAFVVAQGEQSFLKLWMMGGRHGGSK